jgi:HK97 family phage major capsid protein
MNINDLKEKRMNLLNQAKEITSRDSYGAEEKVQVDKILAEIDGVESRMKVLEKEEALEKAAFENKKEETKLLTTSEEIRHYLLTGEVRSAATQTVTTTAGGYAIPEGFRADILKAMLEYGGVYSVAQIFKTQSGNDIPWPTINDTSNKAYLVDINTDPSSDASNAALVFGQKTMKAYKYTSGLIQVPRELLEDEGLSETLSTFIDMQLKERMSRGLNYSFTLGVGTTDIEGVTVGAYTSSVTASASAITKDNFYDVEASVDPAYRRNGRWMFNDSTLTALKKLYVGSSDDRPLWQPSVRDGAPDTILGYPYTINQDMADIGASAKSILFGDFKNYVIREVADWRLVRLNERYAEKDQVGFTLFARYDGFVADAGTHPIKYMAHAAS